MAHHRNKKTRRAKTCLLCNPHKLKCQERKFSGKKRFSREHGVDRNTPLWMLEESWENYGRI